MDLMHTKRARLQGTDGEEVKDRNFESHQENCEK
jgi:hypothetical protein